MRHSKQVSCPNYSRYTPHYIAPRRGPRYVPHGCTFPGDVRGVRFHHRTVWKHTFPRRHRPGAPRAQRGPVDTAGSCVASCAHRNVLAALSALCSTGAAPCLACLAASVGWKPSNKCATAEMYKRFSALKSHGVPHLTRSPAGCEGLQGCLFGGCILKI